VDWRALAAAVWGRLSTGNPRGASTLTMQLAGMLDPALARAPDGRDPGQKAGQIRAALALEKTWSKQQILEAYLNLANFRGELTGIGAASRGLFGKHPSGLDQTEASLLAALLRGPNAGPDIVARRACGIARQLTAKSDCNRITGLAWSTLAVRPQIDPGRQLAPHLAHKLELAPGQARRTTLDAGLQTFAIEVLQQHLRELRDRQVEDGAVVVLDNHSGEVLAWVGSSESTSQNPDVDGVTALRLPGSTLKPFLYGLAIERRLLTAASPLEDSPLALDTPVGQYVPQDYERDFKGWVSVRTALASSLNVPAVRTLRLVGIERFHERLKDLGLASLTQGADFYGYALALGGGEVSLLDLANAYRALANGGELRPVTWLPDMAKSEGRRVMSRQAAWIVSDILADKSARTLTFGLSSPLETLGYAAVKTGTSKDMRDNWCLGYTADHTVGVWVGNASGAPMHDVSGVTGAAPIWQAVMNRLQAARPASAPRLPAGIEAHRVRFDPAIEPERRELFLAGTGLDRIVLAQDHGVRIQGPGNGAILARDPDIPVGRQKVRFQASGERTGLSWHIDEKPADPAWLDSDGSLLWPLDKGAHRISLQDPAGKVADAMFMTVK